MNRVAVLLMDSVGCFFLVDRIVFYRLIIGQSLVSRLSKHLYVDYSVSCFQDELSDANRGGPKSATPISTAPSDAASASVEVSQTEESEGLNRNLNSSSRKPDSSKNIKVQEAVAAEVPPKGESYCFKLQTSTIYYHHPLITATLAHTHHLISKAELPTNAYHNPVSFIE